MYVFLEDGEGVHMVGKSATSWVLLYYTAETASCLLLKLCQGRE